MAARSQTYSAQTPEHEFSFLSLDPYAASNSLKPADGSSTTLQGSIASKRPLLPGANPHSSPSSGLEILGYTDQLTRDHDTLSLFAVCMANIGFLQGTLFGVMATVSMGGSSMLAIGWPVTSVFLLCLTATMAEFGSAWPVAGAMFTWTWKLSRGSTFFRPWGRCLSWVVGSYLLCGHILSQILLSYQFATTLQGTIIIFHPSFNPTLWTTVLIALAEIFLVSVVASLPISRSPYFWKAVLLEILAAFLLLIICLATSLKETRTAEAVFLSYSNTTGFKSAGYVYILGWAHTCLATGQDAACHLSEETIEPARAVPLACFYSVVFTYALGWISICVLLASIPRELMMALSAQYFAPGQILVANMGKDRAGAVLGLVLVAMFLQGLAQIVASSRYTFALARDKALPFHRYFAHVSKKARIPHFAVWGIWMFTSIGLLLIAISSDIVATLILAGCGFSIIFSYAAPSVIYLTIKDRNFLDGSSWRWTLRSASKPISVVTIFTSLVILIGLSFPTRYPIRPVNVGWAPVVFTVVLLLSCLSWTFYGNRQYSGPIKILLGPEIELPTSTSSKSKNSGLTSTEQYGKTAKVFRASGDATAIGETEFSSSTGFTDSQYDSQWTPTLIVSSNDPPTR